MTKRDRYRKYIDCTDISKFQFMLRFLDTKGLRELKGFLSRKGNNQKKIFHINEELKKKIPKVSCKRPWPIELDAEWEEVCRPFREMKRQQQVNEK